MEHKDEFDSLIKKIGKLHKMIRFIAIIHKLLLGHIFYILYFIYQNEILVI